MNHPGKIYFHTFGCKTNQYDTELLRQSLREAGAEAAAEPGDARWVVVNTCAVTRRAEDKARQWIRKMAREHPGLKIAVVGCGVEADSARFDSLPGVALLLGTEEKYRLGAILAGAAGTAPAGENPHCDCGQVHHTREYTRHPVLARHEDRTRAFVKIQDGCDFRCSYCIVPFTRGPGRSRPLSEVLDEVRALEKTGHREVVLTGIHVGMYGADRGETGALRSLVEELLAGTALVRLRLSSLEVGELDPALLRLMAAEPRLCRHLHVPLQHGADAVLERMNRRYRSALFAERLREAASLVPGLGLGTDLIAGFPGESEAEFRQGLELIDSLPLTYLHVFPFSPRPGTPAAELGERPEPATVRRRVRELRELSRRKHEQFLRSQLGTTLTVIAESGGADGLTACRADNYALVYTARPAAGEAFTLVPDRLWRDGLRADDPETAGKNEE